MSAALDGYTDFLAGKAQMAPSAGLDIDPADVHPILKPHQRDAVVWAIHGGRRALFESFGLGKSVQQLEIISVPGLTLTPDHKVWTRKSNWERERDGAEHVEPAWIPASETARGYVNLKLPPTEAASVSDLTYWWAVGRWLADGHIDKRGCAIISVGPSKWDDFCAKIGRFGGNPPRKLHALQVALRDPGFELRRTLKACGRGAAGKHVPPEAFTLPVEQARALLEGYLSGDGHLVAVRDRWMATSVSRELLLGLAVLVQRVHGAIATIRPGKPARTCVIDGRTVQAKQEWVLSFDLPGGRRKHPFILPDGAWKKVRSVEDAGEVETWNLRVEEDESYTAEGCIVKNCPLQFGIVDRLITRYSMEGETVYDPFGGLMTVPYCAVKAGRRGVGVELNSRYFADGVAYVKAAADEASAPALFDLLDAEPADEEAV